MGAFLNFFKKLLGFRDVKREMVYPLEDQIIERDKQIKALVKKIQSVQAQLSHIKAKEREQEEKRKDEDDSLKIVQELNEQQELINSEMINGSFSLNKLFCDIYGVAWKRRGEFKSRSPFGKSLEISDKNDEVAWKFGEILVSKQGYFIITDSENNPRAISSNLNYLFSKPESFENQIRRGRILLAGDKDGKVIPELDIVKISNPVWNSDKQIYEASKSLQTTARELLKERDDLLREQDEKLEHYSMVIAKLKSEVSDLKRAKFIYESKKNIAESELSKALNSVVESDKAIGDLHREVSNSAELNTIYEKKLKSYEKIINEFVAQVEQTGSQTEFRKAMNLIEHSLDFAKKHAPQVVKEVVQEPISIPQVSQK